jgi:hypothetical protein
VNFSLFVQYCFYSLIFDVLRPSHPKVWDETSSVSPASHSLSHSLSLSLSLSHTHTHTHTHIHSYCTANWATGNGSSCLKSTPYYIEVRRESWLCTKMTWTTFPHVSYKLDVSYVSATTFISEREVKMNSTFEEELIEKTIWSLRQTRCHEGVELRGGKGSHDVNNAFRC